MNEISENLARVRERIANAAAKSGRRAADVRLIAISKKQPAARIKIAYDAGQRELGENYVQELEERRASMPKDIVWHLVGHLQTNKVKRAIRAAAVIHTIDSEKLAQTISRAMAEDAARTPRELDVLIEVNVDLEASKAGVPPDRVEPLISVVRTLPHLRLVGLMCIPKEGSGRAPFGSLRELRDRIEKSAGLRLLELSMGMSDDYEDAILEGATLVRVGRAIFGERSA